MKFYRNKKTVLEMLNDPKTVHSIKNRRRLIVFALGSGLLFVLIAVLGVRFTVIGRRMWNTCFSHGQQEAEQKAAKMLRKQGFLVISEPPDRRVTSINFPASPVDDDTLRQISDLYRLMSVNAGNTKITDSQLVYFSDLDNLSSLILQATPITDAGLHHLRTLPAIEALHLSDTLVSDQGLEDIAAMKTLKVLNLSGTKVTDRGIKTLTGLNELNWLLLANTTISDDALVSLASMKNLKRLTAINTNVSAAGIARLRQALPLLSVDTSANSAVVQKQKAVPPSKFK